MFLKKCSMSFSRVWKERRPKYTRLLILEKINEMCLCYIPQIHSLFSVVLREFFHTPWKTSQYPFPWHGRIVVQQTICHSSEKNKTMTGMVCVYNFTPSHVFEPLAPISTEKVTVSSWGHYVVITPSAYYVEQPIFALCHYKDMAFEHNKNWNAHWIQLITSLKSIY